MCVCSPFRAGHTAIRLSSQSRLSLPLFTKQKDASFAEWPDVHNLFHTPVSLSLQMAYFSTKRACLSVCSAQRLLHFLLCFDVRLMLDLGTHSACWSVGGDAKQCSADINTNTALSYERPTCFVLELLASS